jgi:hypothetical protein
VGKVIRFSLLPVGAFAAWGIWIAEVVWIKGWEGLAWLSGFNWSLLPICGLIVIISSYAVTSEASFWKRAAFIGVTWMIMIAAAIFVRRAAFELFAGSIFGPEGSKDLIFILLAGLCVAAGLVISANRWLAPLHHWTAVWVALALLLVLPLSIVTIKAFPAINGSTDQIHSIKMGYPVFWMALLVPATLVLGRKRKVAPPQGS